jgi:hypothetical protein
MGVGCGCAAAWAPVCQRSVALSLGGFWQRARLSAQTTRVAEPKRQLSWTRLKSSNKQCPSSLLLIFCFLVSPCRLQRATVSARWWWLFVLATGGKLRVEPGTTRHGTALYSTRSSTLSLALSVTEPCEPTNPSTLSVPSVRLSTDTRAGSDLRFFSPRPDTVHDPRPCSRYGHALLCQTTVLSHQRARLGP